MEIVDKFFVWWGNPDAYATNAQIQNDLQAAAAKNYAAGLITEEKYQEYQRQIAGTSIGDTLANSYNNGLGETPSQTFVSEVKSNIGKLPQSLGSNVGSVVKDAFSGFFKEAWWVVLLLIGGLIFFVWFRKNT